MNGRADPNKNVNGTLMQSLDVLDFSVIHLSAYERLQRRWAKAIKTHVNSTSLDTVVETSQLLKSNTLLSHSMNQVISKDMNRTVVVMPFLAGENGAGHSKLANRLQYLHACFWSFYQQIPHIVAFVKSEKDYEYARITSGLPFYDVVLLNNLPKSASLPVATVQQTKERIMDRRWDFDYMFFTESDQVSSSIQKKLML